MSSVFDINRIGYDKGTVDKTGKRTDRWEDSEALREDTRASNALEKSDRPAENGGRWW